jgi:hypothetical protein
MPQNLAKTRYWAESIPKQIDSQGQFIKFRRTTDNSLALLLRFEAKSYQLSDGALSRLMI